MGSFRFLHAADLHLDSPFKGMSSLPAVLRDRVIDSTFQALQQVIDLAVREAVDFVLLSGDIYDLSDRSLRAQIRLQQAMEELKRHQIEAFVIHGNHDPLDGHKASLSWPDNVHFFSSDKVYSVPAHNRKDEVVAMIHGVSYQTAAVTDNLALQFQGLATAPYNIGMLHCNVDGDAAHEHYAPCSKQDLLRANMDYWALGHIHTARLLHTHPHIVYPGNTQGRHIRESGEKGCYIVEVNDQAQAMLSFHATDVLRWFHLELSIAELHSEQELIDRLEDELESIHMQLNGRSAIVRMTMVGRGALHRWLTHEAHLHEMLSILRDEQLSKLKLNPEHPFVWLEDILVHTGMPINIEQIMQEDSFLTDVLAYSRELQHDEQKLAEFADEAFASMLQHAQAGKYIRQIKHEELQEWLKSANELAIDLLIKNGE